MTHHIQHCQRLVPPWHGTLHTGGESRRSRDRSRMSSRRRRNSRSRRRGTGGAAGAAVIMRA
jgi:hypothetical protein